MDWSTPDPVDLYWDKYIDKYRYLWSESNKNELKLIEGGKNAAIN